jgi:hypothetical protein
MIKLNIPIIKKILDECGLLGASKGERIDPDMLKSMKYWEDCFVVDEMLAGTEKKEADAALRELITDISGDGGIPALIIKQFKPGDLIITSGQFDQCFIGIIEGEAKVVREGHVCAILGPGSWCGEIAIVNLSPRTADIRARHNSVTIVEVVSSIFEVPIIGGMFWKLIGKALADKLHRSWSNETKAKGEVDQLKEIMKKLEETTAINETDLRQDK